MVKITMIDTETEEEANECGDSVACIVFQGTEDGESAATKLSVGHTQLIDLLSALATWMCTEVIRFSGNDWERAKAYTHALSTAMEDYVKEHFGKNEEEGE